MQKGDYIKGGHSHNMMVQGKLCVQSDWSQGSLPCSVLIVDSASQCEYIVPQYVAVLRSSAQPLLYLNSLILVPTMM